MMKIRHFLASFVLYGVATALNLPLEAINVLVLTDVHSWVGGHGNHYIRYLYRDARLGLGQVRYDISKI
jgi:hypothetical protein